MGRTGGSEFEMCRGDAGVSRGQKTVVTCGHRVPVMSLIITGPEVDFNGWSAKQYETRPNETTQFSEVAVLYRHNPRKFFGNTKTVRKPRKTSNR